MPKSQSLGGSAANDMQYWKDYFTNQSRPGFYDDSDTQAAERAIGTGGQGFSGARQGLLRRSQVMEGFKAIAPFISQQAAFSHANASQGRSEAARMAEIIKQGEIAKEQQQLAERGLLMRDTQAQAARRADLILQGQQTRTLAQEKGMLDQVMQQVSVNSNERMNSSNLASREYLQNDAQLWEADENARNRSWKTASDERAYQNSNAQLGSKLSTDLQLGKNKGANSATQDMLAGIINGNSFAPQGSTPKVWGKTRWENEGLLNQSTGPITTFMAPETGYYGSGGGGTTFGNVEQPNTGTGENDNNFWTDEEYYRVYGGG